jgi:hypothetical protein
VIEPAVHYEVMKTHSSGKIERTRSWDQIPAIKVAQAIANDFNREELENRELELRKTGPTYVVVKATTTFEVLE